MRTRTLGLAVVTLALLGGRCGVAAGEPVLLSDVPDYLWWYGCTPPAAGMMLGYYDRHGYDGLRYDNLVPGSVAELSTFTHLDAPMQAFIASGGHINDFYSGDTLFGGGVVAEGQIGDDRPPPWHEFDSLADFMGTSQDAYGNNNGTSNYYWLSNHTPATEALMLTSGIRDGTVYGLGAYVRYAGYDVEVLYSQPIYGLDGIPADAAGFTFDQYTAEIDAGRPVLIEMEHHVMLGYGYDADEQLVYVHDTSSPGGGSFPWGGQYGDEDWDWVGSHFQVTVLEITGGQPVPEPTTIAMLASALGLLLLRYLPACSRHCLRG